MRETQDLAGKDATFTIVLKYIEEDELPEFNDAFVQDTLGATVTAEEYRQQLKESIQSDNVLEYLYDKVNCGKYSRKYSNFDYRCIKSDCK